MHVVVSDVDGDTYELVSLLGTRIGAIMEDASVVALTMGSLASHERSQAIMKLMDSIETINRLIGAVQVLDR